jgi:hypothetical protein
MPQPRNRKFQLIQTLRACLYKQEFEKWSLEIDPSPENEGSFHGSMQISTYEGALMQLKAHVQRLLSEESQVSGPT